MNSPNARDTILEVAERLIAERGMHGVSAREIVRTAGQRNNSALTYHFGSWDGLLEAIWLEHMGSINALRADMLANSGDSDRLAHLVACYIHPFVAEVAAREPSSYWARFNEQWLTGVHLDFVSTPTSLVPADPRYPRIGGMKLLQELFAGITDELTHLTPDARARRVAMMARFVVSAMATWEREATAGTTRDLEAFETELTSLAIAVLRAT